MFVQQKEKKTPKSCGSLSSTKIILCPVCSSVRVSYCSSSPASSLSPASYIAAPGLTGRRGSSQVDALPLLLLYRLPWWILGRRAIWFFPGQILCYHCCCWKLASSLSWFHCTIGYHCIGVVAPTRSDGNRGTKYLCMGGNLSLILSNMWYLILEKLIVHASN